MNSPTDLNTPSLPRTAGIPETVASTSSPGPVPAGIPGYEIIDELGRGGMGVVYRASQVALNRVVALKMILAGGHAGSEERARFLAEAEAIAAVKHPGIVQVYDFGTHAGLPYFSLELCSGSLAGRLADNPLPAKEAARLVEQVARAVQAAHEAGVVHRDLKPANVLLAGDGSPRVTDFGLARRVEAGPGLTRTGAVMGTPSYMAPEQAAASKAVGPAADVWAVGAILYECLTGRPPFKAASTFDTLAQVMSAEPVAPAALNAQVPRDLETICLKCLQKDPAQRYASAGDLADDFHRWLEGLPIKARPVGPLRRLLKWVRRRPSLAAMTAASLVVAAISFAAVTVKWLEAAQAREQSDLARAEAETQLDRAEANLYFNRIALADREFQAHNVRRARSILADCDPARRGWEWGFLTRSCQGGLRSLSGHADRVSCVCVSPDGGLLASGSFDGTVRLWSRPDGSLVRTLQGHGRRVLGVAFDAKGKRLAVAGSNGLVRLWDPATGRNLGRLHGHKGPVSDVAFAPEGGLLASCGEDHLVILWDLDSGRPRRTLRGHSNTVSKLAFVRGGRCLVSAGFDDQVVGWDVQSGTEVFRCGRHKDGVVGVACSPDGKWIASGAGDRTVILRDALGQVVRVLRRHHNVVTAVAFSPDSRSLASASMDGTVRLWDVESGALQRTLCGHQEAVHGVTFTPQGDELISAGGDTRLKVWSALSDSTCRTVLDACGTVVELAFSSDGSLFASLGEDGKVRLRRTATLAPVHMHRAGRGTLTGVVFGPPPGLLACSNSNRSVQVFRADHSPAATLEGHPGIVRAVAFSPDGRTLASGGHDQTINLWDLQHPEKPRSLGRHDDTVRGLVFAADGHRLFSAAEDRTVQCRLLDGKLAWKARPGAALTHLAGTSDGRFLAASDEQGQVHVLDAGDGRILYSLRGHAAAVNRVVFSPDGKRLASAGADQVVKLWDRATGLEVLELRGHQAPVTALAFSPDGNLLATGGEDQAVKLWSALPLAGE
jgi:WD40 repeat protein